MLGIGQAYSSSASASVVYLFLKGYSDLITRTLLLDLELLQLSYKKLQHNSHVSRFMFHVSRFK